MDIPAVWIYNRNYWDTENTDAPGGFDARLILPAVRRILVRLGLNEPPVLYGLIHSLHTTRMPESRFHELRDHGITLEDLGLDPSAPDEIRRQAVDREMIRRIRSWFDTRTEQSHGLLLMIGGDRDFYSILDEIQSTPGFDVVLIYPRGSVSGSLFAIPFRAVVPWHELLEDYRKNEALEFSGENGDWRNSKFFANVHIAKHVSEYIPYYERQRQIQRKREIIASAKSSKMLKFLPH